MCRFYLIFAALLVLCSTSLQAQFAITSPTASQVVTGNSVRLTVTQVPNGTEHVDYYLNGDMMVSSHTVNQPCTQYEWCPGLGYSSSWITTDGPDTNNGHVYAIARDIFGNTLGTTATVAYTIRNIGPVLTVTLAGQPWAGDVTSPFLEGGVANNGTLGMQPFCSIDGFTNSNDTGANYLTLFNGLVVHTARFPNGLHDVSCIIRGQATAGTVALVPGNIAANCVITATTHPFVTSPAYYPNYAPAAVLTSTGTPPCGITGGTTVYIAQVDQNTIRLATSQANAVSGTYITTAGAGTGTHTLTINSFNPYYQNDGCSPVGPQTTSTSPNCYTAPMSIYRAQVDFENGSAAMELRGVPEELPFYLDGTTTYTITPFVLNCDASTTSSPTVAYTSSNAAVATVGASSGVVTAVGAGFADITATASGLPPVVTHVSVWSTTSFPHLSKSGQVLTTYTAGQSQYANSVFQNSGVAWDTASPAMCNEWAWAGNLASEEGSVLTSVMQVSQTSYASARAAWTGQWPGIQTDATNCKHGIIWNVQPINTFYYVAAIYNNLGWAAFPNDRLSAIQSVVQDWVTDGRSIYVYFGDEISGEWDSNPIPDPVVGGTQFTNVVVTGCPSPSTPCTGLGVVTHTTGTFAGGYADALASCSNATPIVCTYSNAAITIANAQVVTIAGVTGTCAAGVNGQWTVAGLNTGAKTFQLSGSTAQGACTSSTGVVIGPTSGNQDWMKLTNCTTANLCGPYLVRSPTTASGVSASFVSKYSIVTHNVQNGTYSASTDPGMKSILWQYPGLGGGEIYVVPGGQASESYSQAWSANLTQTVITGSNDPRTATVTWTGCCGSDAAAITTGRFVWGHGATSAHGQLNDIFQITRVDNNTFTFQIYGLAATTINSGTDPSFTFGVDAISTENMLTNVKNSMFAVTGAPAIGWPITGVNYLNISPNYASSFPVTSWENNSTLSSMAHVFSPSPQQPTFGDYWSVGDQIRQDKTSTMIAARGNKARPEIDLLPIAPAQFQQYADIPTCSLLFVPGTDPIQTLGPGINPNVTVSQMAYLDAKGSVGHRAYHLGVVGATQPSSDLCGGRHTVGFDQGPTPFAFWTRFWGAMALENNLSARLTPLIFQPWMVSPGMGPYFFSGARTGANGKILMVGSLSSWPRTETIDFTPYRYSGGTILRYRLVTRGGDPSLTVAALSGSATSDTPTFAAGEVIYYAFFPSGAAPQTQSITFPAPSSFPTGTSKMAIKTGYYHNLIGTDAVDCTAGCSITVDPNAVDWWWQQIFLDSSSNAKVAGDQMVMRHK